MEKIVGTINEPDIFQLGLWDLKKRWYFSDNDENITADFNQFSAATITGSAVESMIISSSNLLLILSETGWIIWYNKLILKKTDIKEICWIQLYELLQG